MLKLDITTLTPKHPHNISFPAYKLHVTLA